MHIGKYNENSHFIQLINTNKMILKHKCGRSCL
jgi:hypothetical protein